MKKVAIIGAGLQAKRRVQAIIEDPNYEIKWVISRNTEKAKKLIDDNKIQISSNWQQATKDQEVDVVMVLTYPDTHAKIAVDAMQNGKDVLCEKPLARTEEEAKIMLQAAKKYKRILKCGFNHRFHPAMLEAYRLFQADFIGKPVFIRSRYGIGGRTNIEKEWRSNPKIVSGGQLMEQGIHLVDLIRWFMGDINKATGFVSTNLWPIHPLEDNGFALLQNKHGVTASIHSSLTQWINVFEFEVYGVKGSLTVSGLGGAYGVEKLIVSRHDPDGPFSYKTIEFRGPDTSWKTEWKEFATAVTSRKDPLSSAEDGLEAMRVVNSIYKSSKSGKTIFLKKT